MPYVKKPAAEGFRAQLISNGKPLLEKNIVPIQAALVAQLDTIKDLLVQKSRRVSNKQALVEITATWVGMDASHRQVIATLKQNWSGAVFQDAQEQFYVGSSDDSVILFFAAAYPENRYLTGRILVTF